MEVKRFWEDWKFQAVMAVLAVVGVGVAVYTGFFFERKSEITVTIDSESPVLDIHQPVGGLQISYAGEDLRTSKKSLWTMSITVQNTGTASIKKGDYDDRAPLGIDIVGAKILERPTMNASKAYLQEQATLNVKDHTVTWTPVILEPGDTIKLSLLLLGTENIKPTLVPIGTIADTRPMRLIQADEKPRETTLWKRIVGADSWWIQPLRALVYFLVGAVSLLILTAVAVSLTELPQGIKAKIDKDQRRKFASGFNAATTAEQLIRDLYVDGGEEPLLQIAKTMRDINARETLSTQLFDAKVEPKTSAHILGTIYPTLGRDEDALLSLRLLRKAGLMTGKGMDVAVDDKVKDALDSAANYFHVDLTKEPRELPFHVMMVNGGRPSKMYGDIS